MSIPGPPGAPATWSTSTSTSPSPSPGSPPGSRHCQRMPSGWAGRGSGARTPRRQPGRARRRPCRRAEGGRGGPAVGSRPPTTATTASVHAPNSSRAGPFIDRAVPTSRHLRVDRPSRHDPQAGKPPASEYRAGREQAAARPRHRIPARHRTRLDSVASLGSSAVAAANPFGAALPASQRPVSAAARDRPLTARRPPPDSLRRQRRSRVGDRPARRPRRRRRKG